MSKNTPFVSSAVLGAQYGFNFIPIDRRVFSKTDSEKRRLKNLKKRAVNKGKTKTVISFTCNKSNYGEFGDRKKN